ncbi:MAG: ADP-ribosylglycohydrolase family protein, partial [Deltaproteobacteria bacterium]|nr:ADP-ribosylglycohydrolase family protein [Deltaproteobacteria bacterium]
MGDAFGAHFEFRGDAAELHRQAPAGLWRTTDDTAMALSLVEVLEERGEVDQDALAAAFARRYVADPHRGYGGGARRILEAIHAGGDFRRLAPGLFPGGSYGNGAAMRVAPLGAFFTEEPARCCAQARLSARVTHTHPEAVDGAVVVALAAA